MIRGARVFVHDAEIMCLVVSDSEVYWSAQGTAVSEDWLRRYLENFQHQAYVDTQDAPIFGLD
ncbi:hypothetical protein PAMC26510_16510 [Caballeronia sordidicola]|uniref:Uncharacterized protein n=2 Tax=Caballeronia sordidicola TaxID=196367 RepID=A0A242MST0_CABSO|nr:hypothetical protein PAMC26510_16510 [Caballeronia sordidicola]